MRKGYGVLRVGERAVAQGGETCQCQAGVPGAATSQKRHEGAQRIKPEIVHAETAR